jgi:hypothetical protein
MVERRDGFDVEETIPIAKVTDVFCNMCIHQSLNMEQIVIIQGDGINQFWLKIGLK